MVIKNKNVFNCFHSVWPKCTEFTTIRIKSPCTLYTVYKDLFPRSRWLLVHCLQQKIWVKQAWHCLFKRTVQKRYSPKRFSVSSFFFSWSRLGPLTRVTKGWILINLISLTPQSQEIRSFAMNISTNTKVEGKCL